MALQLLQQPGSLSFASDPIIVKAKTTLTGKTFLRIKLTCTVLPPSGAWGDEYEEIYSYNVSTDGLATFNVSGTVSASVEKYFQQEIQDGELVQQTSTIKYSLFFEEVYIEDRVEMKGDSKSIGPFMALPGGLTEYERMTAPNADTGSLLGTGRMLSRKPDGEIIPKGIPIYLPAVSTSVQSIPYSIKQGEKTHEYTLPAQSIYTPVSIKIGTLSLSLGEAIVSAAGDTGKKKYIASPTPDMRSFVFINGFGLLESVTAVTREAFSYDIQSEQYTVSKEIGFRPTTQVLSYSDSPMASIAMSSGYVSRQWAEWWINEFCVTKKAWLVDGEHPLPVAIIPEETVELYDRSKPSLVAVNFTVRYSFTGGTYNSFV